jgi:hypothetical protein
MDAVRPYVRLFVHDRSVVEVHLSVRFGAVNPDFSQRLGEVFSLLNHWFKIVLVGDSELATDHTKRVAACRDERRLITVAAPPA